jgi:hypothetical protein
MTGTMALCPHRSLHTFPYPPKVRTPESKPERTLFHTSAVRIPYSEGIGASSACWPPRGKSPRPPREALGEGNPVDKVWFVNLVSGLSSPAIYVHIYIYIYI